MTAVRRESEAADGADPLDEAGRMALAHSGLDGAALWVHGDDGFALLRGTGWTSRSGRTREALASASPSPAPRWPGAPAT